MYIICVRHVIYVIYLMYVCTYVCMYVCMYYITYITNITYLRASAARSGPRSPRASASEPTYNGMRVCTHIYIYIYIYVYATNINTNTNTNTSTITNDDNDHSSLALQGAEPLRAGAHNNSCTSFTIISTTYISDIKLKLNCVSLFQVKF